MPAIEPALLIKGLVKDVGPVPALDGRMKRVVSGVDFAAEFGAVTVLLGSNGAGKTTTLECAQGLTKRQGGTVRLLGQDPENADPELRARVGVMLQDGGLPPSVRASTLLNHVAKMYADPVPYTELNERLGLNGFADTAIRRLSGGQRQRIALAAALIGKPEIVFLDEPSAGLDPQSRQLVFDVIQELREQNVAVVLTTHLLEDAQRLADMVYFIDAGKTVAHGTIPELLAASAAQPEQRRLRFEAEPDLDVRSHVREEVTVEQTRPGFYEISGDLTASDLNDLTRWWAELNMLPSGLELSSVSLEDVFLSLAGTGEEKA